MPRTQKNIPKNSLRLFAPAAVLLEQLDDQQLVVRYGELRDGIHRTHVAFPLRHQHLVVACLLYTSRCV